MKEHDKEKMSLALTIATNNDDKETQLKKLKKLKLSKKQMSNILKKINKLSKKLKESNKMNSIDKILNEASKEITGLYTIIIKDGNTSRRFTFQSHKIGSLKKELAKRYGSKIVTKVATAIKKAETKGTLKYFAKDDSVDFEVDGEDVKAVFKEKSELEEANIEIKDKNATVITVNGKAFAGGYGALKAAYPKHFAALKLQLKKDKKSIANFGGNDSAVDITAKADGTITVNYDA